MKEPLQIKYIRIMGFLFDVFFFLVILFLCINAPKIENMFLLLLVLSICVLIKKIIYDYWMNAAHSFLILKDEVIFFSGKKQTIYLRKDCIQIDEKDSCYYFFFKNGDRIILRKMASNFEYKNNIQVNTLNFPNASITKG